MMRTHTGFLKRMGSVTVAMATALAACIVLPLAASPAAADPGPTQTTATTDVSADVLPTAQIDGVVWSQVVNSLTGTVYAGGSFATARPAGSGVGVNTVPRNNLVAYTLSTGVMTAFNPYLNAQVQTVVLSPDNKTLYVGGDFTTASGSPRSRIAAYNLTTGALISSFAPSLNARVKSIVVVGSTVYVGGSFTTANGVTRNRLAAFSASGALLNWNPNADYSVSAMVLTPDASRLIVGGAFANVGGSANYGLAALNLSTAASMGWAANSSVQNGGQNAGITSLTTDGTAIYGTGYVFGAGGNLEGTFSAEPDTGNINWVEDCHGDTYGAYSTGSTVYTVSHAHFCGDVGGFPQTSPNWTFHHALAFTTKATGSLSHNPFAAYKDWYGTPSPSLKTFFPDFTTGTKTGQNQAAWSVTGNATYIVMGGEFPTVGGKAQQGLVRFAVRGTTGNPGKIGPEASASMKPTLASLSAGTARVSWRTTYDRDDLNLTYKVFRDSNLTTPVYTVSQASTFWNEPFIGFTDTGLTVGRSYAYRVYAYDPYGNLYNSGSATVTVGSNTPSRYAQDVAADGASHFWRFGETSGTAVVDWAGYDGMTVNSGVTRGAAGSINGDSNGASTFDGNTGFAVNGAPIPGPNTFTEEAWFQTTSTTGGKIISFGDQPSGNSGNYDRHIYMDGNGYVWFGVYNNGMYLAQSAKTYNDGIWHQAVATMSSTGLVLFVDGVKVAANSGTTVGQSYTGYWRVGGDSAWNGNPYFNGNIDDAAVYPTVLTLMQIQKHYIDSGRSLPAGATPPNAAPTAAFSSAPTNLSVAFDGTGSKDSDGTINSYSWDFGDHSAAGSGATPVHTYASAGSFTVILTVTDDGGATSSASHVVSVTAPANAAPVAAFGSSGNNLTVNFDGTGSKDSDGTIRSYSWDFGDQSAAGTGATPAHIYASAGSFTVILTVTDDGGATNSVSHAVSTVNPLTPTPFATDTFSRTVTSGWSSANLGGAWTTVGTAANASVASGAGTLALPAAGNQVAEYLGAATRSSTDLTVQVTPDKVGTGGGTFVYAVGRRVSLNNEYRARVRFASGSKIGISIAALKGSATEVALASEVVLPGTFAAGSAMNVRFEVFGTNPTTLRLKVWAAGTSEPTAWQLSASDSTAALQSAGTIGITSYLSGTSTSAPMSVKVKTLDARPVGQ